MLRTAVRRQLLDAFYAWDADGRRVAFRKFVRTNDDPTLLEIVDADVSVSRSLPKEVRDALGTPEPARAQPRALPLRAIACQMTLVSLRYRQMAGEGTTLEAFIDHLRAVCHTEEELTALLNGEQRLKP